MSSVEPSLTTDLLDVPIVAGPRGPWRDFWGYFSANHGAELSIGALASPNTNGR